MKKYPLPTFLLLLVFFSFGSAQQGAPTGCAQIYDAVVNGKAISLPDPVYPAAARAVGASGVVKVMVLIDEAGNVVSAEAVSGHPLLRTASEKAAREAKFKPTVLAGDPVKVSGLTVYNFNLPATTPDYEKQLKYMGLGAFLTISETIPPDEWEPFEKTEFEATPELAADLEPLISITPQTDLKKRIGITRNISATVETKLNGDKLWQFKLGKLFGEAMIELNNFIDGKPDQTVIKAKLAGMRNMLSTTPADFPPEIRRRLTEITGFADTPDFFAEENLTPFMELVTETLDIISPD